MEKLLAFNRASELAWSYANDLPKHLSEMLLGTKASQSAHVGDAERFILQKELCAVDPCPQNILVRAQAGRFGKQQHKMVRRHPGNLGHGHHANVCAIVRVDVVDDSGYTFLANGRILSLRLLTFSSKRYRENIGQMLRFWSILPKNWSKKQLTGQTAV